MLNNTFTLVKVRFTRKMSGSCFPFAFSGHVQEYKAKGMFPREGIAFQSVALFHNKVV